MTTHPHPPSSPTTTRCRRPATARPASPSSSSRGKRRADAWLSSAGEICGHFVQVPDSVVTHTFTGTATIEEADRHRLEGKEAFLEIRLAEDGRAHVFATT